MIDVSGEEAAEIVGIFARAAAAAFVRQEFDTVDVREKPRRLRAAGCFQKRSRCEAIKLARSIKARKIAHKLLIALRAGKAEFFLQGALQNGEVPVFAKDERKNDPVIARADLAVGAAIAKEGPGLPTGGGRRGPIQRLIAALIGRRIVANVFCRKKLATGNFLRSLADEHAIHNDVAARFKIDRGEFVFCVDIFGERVIVSVAGDRFSGLKRKECDDDVIARVELQSLTLQSLIRLFHLYESSQR